MLQILDLLLGLLAWGILIVSIAKNKTFTRERMIGLCFASWLCCAIALYIPSLCQYLEFRVKDYDSVIDCVSTYHLLSAVLLTVNIVLTVVSIVLQSRKK